jgi:hypothetical protein
MILAGLLIALSATAAIGQIRPKKFCGCPDHQRPSDARSVETPGARYRLHAYNDAFRSSLTDPWCYTRAVWFEAVRGTGRFEWRASDEAEVLAGAIAQDNDPCETQSSYESPANPAQQPSTIEHGPMLGSSTSITLHSADGDEFKPTWPQRLKRLLSTLTGFATLPGSPSLMRVTVRVTSTVLGSTPPYTLEYRIDSPSGHSLNLREFGRSPASAERYPRLVWEAAVSTEFYDEMQHSGFVDGGAPVAIQVKSVPGVVSGIGRLLILPPGVPPPQPGNAAKDALLLGTASAFRVVPQPAPPSNLGVQ